MITIYTSRNFRDRAVRCGVSEQRIEPSEPCIYVRTGRQGNDTKPRALFELVVDVLRRGGWGEIIAPALGLEVRLITLPGDAIVLVGHTVVYTEDRLDKHGFNDGWPAVRIARWLSEALGTDVLETDLVDGDAFWEFVVKNDIPEEEWTYRDFAAAVLGIPPEEVQYG